MISRHFRAVWRTSQIASPLKATAHAWNLVNMRRKISTDQFSAQLATSDKQRNSKAKKSARKLRKKSALHHLQDPKTQTQIPVAQTAQQIQEWSQAQLQKLKELEHKPQAAHQIAKWSQALQSRIDEYACQLQKLRDLENEAQKKQDAREAHPKDLHPRDEKIEDCTERTWGLYKELMVWIKSFDSRFKPLMGRVKLAVTSQGLYRKDTAAAEAWFNRLHLACSAIDRQNSQLHIMCNLASRVAYQLLRDRITARLAQVDAFLSAEDCTYVEIRDCSRSISRGLERDVFLTGLSTLPLLTAVRHLRREAISLGNCGRATSNEPYMQNAEILLECVAAAKRLARLWVEHDLARIGANHAFRSKQLTLVEALDEMDRQAWQRKTCATTSTS